MTCGQAAYALPHPYLFAELRKLQHVVFLEESTALWRSTPPQELHPPPAHAVRLTAAGLAEVVVNKGVEVDLLQAVPLQEGVQLVEPSYIACNGSGNSSAARAGVRGG